MRDSPPPANQAERIALITRLWHELHTTRPGTSKHKAIARRIREEADALRAALDQDDPEKF